MNEEYLCRCGEKMVEVGIIRSQIQEKADGTLAGIKPIKLFQCPNCKVVLIK